MHHLRRARLILCNALIVLCGVSASATSVSATSAFLYTFNAAGTLNEAGSLTDSTSPYFWLNSGGELRISSGTGKTIQGVLPLTDIWRAIYAADNPGDTDGGQHPQNLFRLITRMSAWRDADTSVQFRINDMIMSATENRGGYSGVLLMARYKDGQNLYYAGVRQDGDAVIKKKIGGVYYTLAEKKLFPGTYDRWENPNLIPANKWMGLKLRTVNAGGGVALTLSLDRDNDGGWKQVLAAADSGTGGAPLGAGSSGLRTDYMDVEFDDFRIVGI